MVLLSRMSTFIKKNGLKPPDYRDNIALVCGGRVREQITVTQYFKFIGVTARGARGGGGRVFMGTQSNHMLTSQP